ncbi:MAG: 3-phenylpropionate/trans-cinnamate dioxygenase ferredoxin reductase component [Thermoleophilales bacterium]|nr:3-phenylpropionate/trans-cinnamate dioxygenase ferredoxin reductase component [Thermoleophilales bacterium]
MEQIVIAGGGLAGQRCAEALRARGYEGSLRMVCAEPVRPYDRPPLSKDALSGEFEGWLRPEAWYADNEVDLLLGVSALGVRGRVLETSAGPLAFDRLLVATGAEPRRLPFGEPLRTVADADALRSRLRPGSRLAIIGAGFVGMEVASSARALGVDVALIDVVSSPLAGLLGDRVSSWLAALHRSEGVELFLGEGVVARRRGGLELVSGRFVACDHVVVGVGVVPGVRFGEGRDDVFFAGDVTGTQHWDAAVRQAQAAARAMLGLDPPPPALPSFWSDQYGLRIQYVGDATGADGVAIDGEPELRDFSAVYTTAGRPVAALAVNRPRELPALRRLVQNQEVPK